jgi:hypothetical protein
VDDSLSPSVAIPAGLKVVASPIRPDNLKYFGETYSSPFASYWHDALFQNYDKMLATGTFSAPLLRSLVPSNKTVLHPRIACQVKIRQYRISMTFMLGLALMAPSNVRTLILLILILCPHPSIAFPFYWPSCFCRITD